MSNILLKTLECSIRGSLSVLICLDLLLILNDVAFEGMIFCGVVQLVFGATLFTLLL